MFTSGDRASWLNNVASKIMDGGNKPPSMEYLLLVVPLTIITKENDGHATAAAKLGETARDDFRAGWRIIVEEMVVLLREQGFIDGNDQALRWSKPLDGTWKVAMPDGAQISIFGQRERRISHDRSIIGERNENDGSRVGVPSLVETGRGHPFKLQVIGARGGITEQSFELHPFAMAIPPMTEAERETLRTSIERDGVKVPIVIYRKKILDGRNRAFYASVFKKPVRIEEFTGTEDEARRHVAILNLHRRQLNVAQRYLAAVNLFGEKVAKETAEALEKGRVRGGESHASSAPISVQSKDAKRAPQWHQKVASEAAAAGIPNVSSYGVLSMKEVIGSPKTIAKIESGEITTVAAANAHARAEKALPVAITPQGVTQTSVNRRLGQCIEHLNEILRDCEMPLGQQPAEKISERLTQVEVLTGQVRKALQQRRIIGSAR